MISSIEIREKLNGYPETVLQSYENFLAGGNNDSLHAFVIGLLQFLQDTTEDSEPQSVSDNTKLREDMGLDSITIAEVVFLLEEIFEIEISNDELMDISTIGQLRQFVESKVS